MTATRYRRHPSAIWRATRSFLVAALPPAPPSRVVGSAAAIWNALEAPRTLDDVVDDLVVATGAERATISRDVTALVGELVHLGLVEVVS